MNLPIEPRRSRKRKAWPALFLLSIMILFIVIAAWFVFEAWKESQPNRAHIDPSFGDQPKPIFYKGDMLGDSASGTGDSLALSLDTIKEELDPFIHFEEKSESVIITTEDKVIRLKTDKLTAWVNEKPMSIAFPVEKQEDRVYVPLKAIEPYYHFSVRESDETGAVLLFKEGDVLQWAEIAADQEEKEAKVALRLEPTIKAPILSDLKPGDRVLIWSEDQDWYRVQLMNGWIGYVLKNDTILAEPEVIAYEKENKATVAWRSLGGRINLSWEHVVSKNPNTAKIWDMPGLNVISPTWFYLADDQGNLGNKANHSYVNWAHKRGYQVWALFSNDFDPDRTKTVLADYDTRMHVIRQLVSFAEIYDLQGINIDFENVYEADKEKLTQFVRELTPFLHEQGLVVSIDVTIRGGSSMWSLFLDREALGKTVDYMMVMTYDEHWASSPVAGSVASLPWAEKGITDIMREDHVPASKLLLGVPYYTRIWTEKSVDGKTKVTSKAVGMDTVRKLIAEKKLTPVYDEETGQDYVEYKEDGALNRIWIENETSIRARIELVKKHDLAGVATWRRGFETEDIWPLIQETLEKRP